MLKEQREERLGHRRCSRLSVEAVDARLVASFLRQPVVALLGFHEFLLEGLLVEDLVAEDVQNVLLPLCVVLEVALHLIGHLVGGQVVGLQRLHEPHDFDAVVFLEAGRREVDELAVAQALRLPLVVLRHQLGPLVFVKKVEHFLDLVRVICHLDEVLGLLVQRVKLLPLHEEALLQILALHFLDHQFFLEEQEVVVQLTHLLAASLGLVRVQLRDVVEPEGRGPDFGEPLLEKRNFLVFQLLLQFLVLRVHLEVVDVSLNVGGVVLHSEGGG